MNQWGGASQCDLWLTNGIMGSEQTDTTENITFSQTTYGAVKSSCFQNRYDYCWPRCLTINSLHLTLATPVLSGLVVGNGSWLVSLILGGCAAEGAINAHLWTNILCNTSNQFYLTSSSYMFSSNTSNLCICFKTLWHRNFSCVLRYFSQSRLRLFFRVDKFVKLN